MTALAIMERNELAGKKPAFLARKIVRIVECKNPKAEIYNRCFVREDCCSLEIYSSREIFQMDTGKEF